MPNINEIKGLIPFHLDAGEMKDVQDILNTGMLINFFQFLVILLHIKLKNTYEKADQVLSLSLSLSTYYANIWRSGSVISLISILNTRFR
jgi:hypothetical protein